MSITSFYRLIFIYIFLSLNFVYQYSFRLFGLLLYMFLCRKEIGLHSKKQNLVIQNNQHNIENSFKMYIVQYFIFYWYLDIKKVRLISVLLGF